MESDFRNIIKRFELIGCLIGLIFLNTKTVAIGQSPYDPLKVISPSPTAASLGAYANEPVNYYSGTVGVSIPVYNIKTNNNELSVKLQYYSTGVKVADNAGWVGLGWSLSCGGVITKTVRGKDDLFESGSSFTGYYNAGAIPPLTDLLGSDNSPLSTYDQTYFSNFYAGNIDTDPDIFSYNFGSYAGKFCMGKLNDGSMIYLDQQNGVKLIYTQSTDKWVATDPLGYKYYLGTQEKVQDFNVYSNIFESGNDVLAGDNSSNTPYLTNSWYVDQIVAPNGESIQFTYQKPSQSKSLISKSEQEYDAMDAIFGYVNAFGCNGGCQALYHQYIASQQIIQDVNLKQITFSNGSILFNTTDRDDIEYIGTVKPQKLSEIIINDDHNNLIKKYTLNYTYFLSSTSTSLSNDYTNRRRLALQSVVETGSDGKTKPPYSLSYFNPNNIPYKFSKAIDHWGYYNGQTTNTTLLTPKIIIQGNVSQSFAGANRKPDSEDSNLLYGILSSITYPTGGSTSFTYELNDYANLKGDDQYSLQPQYVIANSVLSTYTVGFDIATIDTVAVTFRSNFKTDGNVSYVGDYAHVYKNGALLYQFSETAPQPEGVFYSNPQTATVVLLPGHYTMDIRNIAGVTNSISASWNHKVPVTKQKGGGLRISSITNYHNGSSKASFKKITYNMSDGSSSGRLTSPQLYDFILPGFSYISRLANSIATPGLNSNVGTIGYSKVTELEGANGENGKTEYYYHNADDQVNSNYMMNIPVLHDPLNGKLEEKIVYDASGKIIEKTGYKYQVQLSQTSKLTGLTRTPLIPGVGIVDCFPTITSGIKVWLRYYDIPSYWVVQTSQADTLYDLNQNAIIANNRYYYNNTAHRNMTASELIKSNGYTIGMTYSYPQDYHIGTTFIDNMVTANIVSNPVETLKYQIDGGGNKTILAGTIKTYKTGGKGLVDQIQMFESNQPLNSSNFTYSSGPYSNPTTFTPDTRYKPRLYFDSYDVNGNLLQQHKSDDINHSYIWNYNNSYPIAEAINASATDIAYTSFEADGKGNWNNYAGTITTVSASPFPPTGTKYYNLTTTNTLGKPVTNGKKYIVSYWSKNGAYSISGGTGTSKTGRAYNGWTYYEHAITASSTTLTISGTGAIDEVRLYPADAQMTTYTYQPLVGMTSQCDANNRIIYYEYDGLGRLNLVKDQDGNILKKNQYQYQVTVP